eukprot:13864-Heterococcus_DN1.PRE.3
MKACTQPPSLRKALSSGQSTAASAAVTLSYLDEVRHVHGHLFDLGVVEGLDVAQVAHICLRDEVDGHTLAAKPAAAANPVDVVLSVGGQVVVDDQGHLLHIDAAGQQICCDEHT